MKILFLHFSDLHYENVHTFSSTKIESMKKAIKCLFKKETPSEAFIIFSGDLTMSGQKKQFDGVKKIIGSVIGLFKEIFAREYKVRVLSVPGNHDIDFGGVNYGRSDIKQQMNCCYENVYSDYIRKLSNYFEFANYNNNFITHKIVHSEVINIQGFRIKINLINSALFSVYSNYEEADYDDGLHHISKTELDILKTDKQSNLNITVMHHSPYLFDDDSKKLLNEFLKENNQILFYGHEHINSNELSILNGRTTQWILGGPLSKKGESIFNCVIYDTDTTKIRNYRYEWNESQTIYEEKLFETQEKISVYPTYFNNEFIKSIRKDNLFDIDDFNDIFVFPNLIYTNLDSKDKIDNFKKLNKVIEENSICIIEGDNSIGKTTLAKYLYLELMKDYYPLLLNSNTINDLKINKVIKLVHNEQYNIQKLSFSKFEQFDKQNKIAIVDDVDKISENQLELFISELKKVFGKIVLIKNSNSDFDLVSIVKNYSLDNEQEVRLKIENFYYDKRLELLHKFCKYFNSKLSNNKLKEKINLINSMITNQLKFFQMTPSYIALFAKTMIMNNYEFGSGTVFNAVFQSNITSIIKECSSLDTSTTLLLLQRIAYHIHKNKEYPLSQKSFMQIIEEYNKEGSKFRKPINGIAFLNNLIQIRLLYYSDQFGGIKFYFNSYLSFFVAKEALKRMEENVITDMIANIFRGINGDILLFMCYLDENKQGVILDYILNGAENFYINSEQLDLSNVNISYLQKKQKNYVIKNPSEDDKKRNKILKASSEKMDCENQKLTVNDIYDYDKEIDEMNKYFTTGIKYIEILSKVLPDFIHSLDDDRCELIVNSLYINPNKFLYRLLKEVDLKIQEIIEENKGDIHRLQNFISDIQRMSISLILSVYNIVASFASCDLTKKALEQFDYKTNTSYYLINCLIENQIGDTDRLGTKLVSIYDQTDSTLIQNMCKIIFYNHCMNNQIMLVGVTQKYVNKFMNLNNNNVAKLRYNNKK